VEEFVHAGYDLDAAAILLCESDGTPEESRRRSPHDGGAQPRRRDRHSRLGERSRAAEILVGPGSGVFRVGSHLADYYCMDGTIPRKRLGEVLHFIGAMEKKYGLRCPTSSTQGDGNLHPLILFDGNDPDQLHRTEQFASEVLQKCIEVGVPSPA